MDTIKTGSDGASARLRVVALIPVAIALNLALGTLANTLKLPIYLDAVGTIAAVLLIGLRAGVVVGVTSFLIGGVLTNPVLPWFAGTQAVIALYTFLVARRGWLTLGGSTGHPTIAPRSARLIRYARPVLCGIGLGLVAGIVSAPVIVALFGGVTGSGPSLVVAFLLKSGETLYKAVLISGFASEPIDKTIQLLLALGVIRSLPRSLKKSLNSPLLERNGLL